MSLGGEKTTPNVFRPASLSPLMSFRSFKKRPDRPKQRKIKEIIAPFITESEKISQILIVYAGYAMLYVMISPT